MVAGLAVFDWRLKAALGAWQSTTHLEEAWLICK